MLMNRRDSRGAHGITTAITNRALQPGVSAHREPKWSTPCLRTHLLDKCNLQPWAAVAAAAAAAAAEAGAAAGAAVAAFDRCTRRSCRPWGDFLTSSLLRESRLLSDLYERGDDRANPRISLKLPHAERFSNVMRRKTSSRSPPRRSFSWGLSPSFNR